MLTGSINLSKIDKNKIFTSQKGEKFLNLTVWLNDEVDNYGNIAGIQQSCKKDEAKIYLGNLKDFKPAEPKPEPQPQQTFVANSESDDLPF